MSGKHVNARDINESITWHETSHGGDILGGGTSALFNTGDWRTMIPTFVEEKCKHCMLCVPTCPDSSIPVKDGKRADFDFMHCKGCGVCWKVCPFGAITYGREEK